MKAVQKAAQKAQMGYSKITQINHGLNKTNCVKIDTDTDGTEFTITSVTFKICRIALVKIIMLGAVDAIMRPLKIPTRFMPYMEKHRIYELFHELATELAIKQPSDHILYLKQCLRHAVRKRDSSRIILLGPSGSDMCFLAQNLQKELGVKDIFLQDIQNVTPEVDIQYMSEEEIVKNLREILKNSSENYFGWVLVGVPRTKSEARAFQLAGIIPTHVLEIVPSTECRCPSDTSLRNQNLEELRKIYENFLIKVEAGDRTINELAEACTLLAERKKPCGAPCIFRVALIGSRGSGCRSVAKHLSRRFDLVHVDFYEILQQAEMQETILGEELRKIECRCNLPNPDLRIRVIEKYLLADNCTKRGWVLTGYPITVDDFELLDMISTPPNRVIFIEMDDKTRKQRLLNRRYNVITGSEHNLHSKNNCDSDIAGKLMAIHPKDCKCIIEQEIQEYEKNLESLLCYAGMSASIIDGNAEERIIRERVEACLMRAAPCAPPREPRLSKEIDPMDIEFDPDDEPDPRIFDKIREPESNYSFV